MTVALVDGFDRGGLAMPGGKGTAAPRFLDGTPPQWKADLGNRAALAQWISRLDNPFFARAAVNRVWTQFFGRSLAPPPDAADSAPAGHAELLQELAAQIRRGRLRSQAVGPRDRAVAGLSTFEQARRRCERSS